MPEIMKPYLRKTCILNPLQAIDDLKFVQSLPLEPKFDPPHMAALVPPIGLLFE